MKTYKIYNGATKDGRHSMRIAIDVEEIGIARDDDVDEGITKPEDWFIPGFKVTEVGEIYIEGNIDLLYPSFAVDADIEFSVI